MNAGEQYPYGQLQCQGRVYLQGATGLTAAEVEETVAKVAPDHGRLTNICQALGSLAKPSSEESKTEKSEKELHVFCNPLFGST